MRLPGLAVMWLVVVWLSAACSVDVVTFTSACKDNVWGRDLDGDGHGDPKVTAVGCQQPHGYVLGTTDCDDTDAEEHPGRGSCPYRPAEASSCLDILNDGNSEGNGAYVIDPDSAGPATKITVYCDMENGGWTALVNPTGKGFAAQSVPDLVMSSEYTAGTVDHCAMSTTPQISNFANEWFGISEYTCGDRAIRYHIRWPNPFGATDVRFVATAQGKNGSLRVNGVAIMENGKVTDDSMMVCRFWNGTGETAIPPGGLNRCVANYPVFPPRVLVGAFTGPLHFEVEVGKACDPNCAYGVGMNLYMLFVR